ncbi:MAG: NFACT family protein, partial [Clostridia bacterium]|nr:NFACT family protein [Clostridia bacterium]
FMGRHSNLIFVHNDGRIIDSVVHVTDEISRVREVLPGLKYQTPPEQGKLCYDGVSADELAGRLSCAAPGPLYKALAAAVSGLSPQTSREIVLRATGSEEVRVEDCDAQAAAGAVAGFLVKMPGLTRPMLVQDEEGKVVDVTPFEYLTRRHLTNRPLRSISEAIEAFSRNRDQADRIHQKSSALNRVLKNNIERCEKKLGLQMQALMDSARMEEYRIKGELLTAGLHQVVKGMKAVELTNYYDPECRPMLIELDVKLSPGANAQRYFKLYQKARSARDLAAEQKAKTEEELSYLLGQLENLGNCTEEAELFEIRTELEQQGYVKANHNRRQMKSLPPSKPLKFTSSEGIIILVGKNNLQNDKLTGSAQPNEIWMHAKDMPGSHVIIVDENPGEKTMEEAASLAAWYSSGRTSGRVPIDYTRRKYVKKPGGAKPGFVIYTHQKTIIAQPRETLDDKKN